MFILKFYSFVLVTFLKHWLIIFEISVKQTLFWLLYRRESEFIRRPCPYRTLPFSAKDRLGRPRSVPYFFDRFPWFLLKSANSTAIKMLPFCSLNANFHRSTTRTVFRYFNIKSLNLMEFTWKINKNRYFCGTLRAYNSI